MGGYVSQMVQIRKKRDRHGEHTCHGHTHGCHRHKPHIQWHTHKQAHTHTPPPTQAHTNATDTHTHTQAGPQAHAQGRATYDFDRIEAWEPRAPPTGRPPVCRPRGTSRPRSKKASLMYCSSLSPRAGPVVTADPRRVASIWTFTCTTESHTRGEAASRAGPSGAHHKEWASPARNNKKH
jgi:hypothetical protein